MAPKPKLSHLNNPQDLVTYLWNTLSLPSSSLSSLQLITPPFASHPPFLPSSFKVDLLATSTIALFTLLVAHYQALQFSLSSPPVPPKAFVNTLAASLEFKSERMYTLNGASQPAPSSIGGLHKTSDGYVRIHDGFRVHRDNVRCILGLPPAAGRTEVAAACLKWKARELEEVAAEGGAIVSALRREEEWEIAAMGKGVPDIPIAIKAFGDGVNTGEPGDIRRVGGKGFLSGLRVLEFSRVIAAPVAGRALAVHGADVVWVTSPNLEDQPYLDVEFSRGKRSVRLDLDVAEDMEKVRTLVQEADVLIQGFRPGSLENKGLRPEQLKKINPRLVYASLSAYPQVEEQPWRGRRGFDSMVQTCSGINLAEAEAWNVYSEEHGNVPAKVLPCQALDHASGFLLASGIVAALCKRFESGEGQLVEVSLAGTSKVLRSLGQRDDGFESGSEVNSYQEALKRYGKEAESLFEERDTDFGTMKFLKHAGQVEGAEVSWERMPRPLGSDEPSWL
ncbi:CoA-transferase family III [Stipitochalara longipes BDJ]|nr:CoA-transferase family III [Stipitochalara longipes BDJ]